MDLIATDALGREWQLSTVQIDMVQPARFKLKYAAADGTEHQPVIIHRAVLGSAERAMMVLIEHYAGAFPLWLSPVQLKILTISEKEAVIANEFAAQVMNAGIRVEVDESNRSLGKKIAVSRNEKTPYIAVVGAEEIKNRTLTLKNREGLQTTLTLDETIAKLRQEIQSKI
jgi:threonyl-tRNA synthetase